MNELVRVAIGVILLFILAFTAAYIHNCSKRVEPTNDVSISAYDETLSRYVTVIPLATANDEQLGDIVLMDAIGEGQFVIVLGDWDITDVAREMERDTVRSAVETTRSYLRIRKEMNDPIEWRWIATPRG